MKFIYNAIFFYPQYMYA